MAKVTITDRARAKLQSLFQQQGESVVGLRILAEAISPLYANYHLSFVQQGEAKKDDVIIEDGGIRFFVDPDSLPYVDGATLDYLETPWAGQFRIQPPPPPRPQLKGPVAQKLQKLIDERINPALAMHGGHVVLVDVKDNVAYIELGGGCRGCGMVNVTLKQGIETMIKEYIPEIKEVLDVTDHASGTNPYYRPNK